MNNADVTQPTPLDGIHYFMPPSGYVLTGRDGRVNILWDNGLPIPILEED